MGSNTRRVLRLPPGQHWGGRTPCGCCSRLLLLLRRGRRFAGTSWHCPQLGSGWAHKGAVPRCPRSSPKRPRRGWAPPLAGRWKTRACREGCAGRVTPWGLWPGEGNALCHLALHNTSLAGAPCGGGAHSPAQTGRLCPAGPRAQQRGTVRAGPGAQRLRGGKLSSFSLTARLGATAGAGAGARDEQRPRSPARGQFGLSGQFGGSWGRSRLPPARVGAWGLAKRREVMPASRLDGVSRLPSRRPCHGAWERCQRCK